MVRTLLSEGCHIKTFCLVTRWEKFLKTTDKHSSRKVETKVTKRDQVTTVDPELMESPRSDRSPKEENDTIAINQGTSKEIVQI